jgi:hypothetical protein
MFAINMFFAGLWPLVWHWGIPVGVIILCLVAEVVIQMAGTIPFVDKVLKPLQKDLLWVAACAAFFLFAFADGVKVEHTRSVAQGNALTKQIGHVVDEVLQDPANQPQVQKPVKKGDKPSYRPLPHDQWDNPEN